MEAVQVLLASKDGFAALATVSLAVTMLMTTLGALAYKANKASRSIG